jgi:probable HAF family extracellular repeat protein
MSSRQSWTVAALCGVLITVASISYGAGKKGGGGGTPSYSVTDLGTFGGTTSDAYGINGDGQVVGDATTAAGTYHAFVYDNGTMKDLGLAGTSATARAINSSGQIVGYYYDGAYEAFLYSGGKVTDLGNLGGNYSAGYGISSTGQACGSADTTSNDEHAFLWSAGTMTDYNCFGGNYSSARGVNTLGQVVGFSYLPNGAFHAFVRQGSFATDLGTLGGDYSEAEAVNDAGQVVGQAYLPGNGRAHAFLWIAGSSMRDLGELGAYYSEAEALDSTASRIVGRAAIPNNTGYIVYHAFLYASGRMTDLNTLIPATSGWVLGDATGVNDSGQIVGTGTVGGQPHAFLLNPR